MVYPRPSLDAAIGPGFPSFSAGFPDFSDLIGPFDRRTALERELTPIHFTRQYSSTASMDARQDVARTESDI